MYDKFGEKLEIGDFVKTRARDFGKYGFRDVAMVVDVNNMTLMPDKMALLFGGDTYPLIYTVAPTTATKIEPTDEQVALIEPSRKIFLDMQQDLAGI